MASNGITDRIDSCKDTEDTSHVVLHTGDIDVRTNPKNAFTAVLKVIDRVLEVFNDDRILVNTLPESNLAGPLRENIITVNNAIIAKCNMEPELTMVDCRNLKLKDCIHFTAGSVNEVAHVAVDHINNKYF